jgi:surfeit locus 1 family protein
VDATGGPSSSVVRHSSSVVRPSSSVVRRPSSVGLFKPLLSRRYWWATLVVLLGMAFLARLGFWQLDRLEQRRARNAQIAAQLAQPPLPLTGQPLPGDLAGLKNRRASASGQFDFAHQVALKEQHWMGAPGVHLIAPLVIQPALRSPGGTHQAVLVDRGWLPLDQAAPQDWSVYNQPGPVSVTGFIQLSQTLPAGAPPGGTGAADAAQAAPAAPQRSAAWYRVDIPAIQAQVPYELLPVYLLQVPPEGNATQLPYRAEPEVDLSDGPHLGYAIQWFIFSLILGIIYVRYVNKKEPSQPAATGDSDEA